jgi:hypothetical protein
MDHNQQPIQVTGEAGICIRSIAESLMSGNLQRMDLSYLRLRKQLQTRLGDAQKEIDKLFKGNE